MDESMVNADVFINRYESSPVLQIPGNHDGVLSSDSEDKHDRVRQPQSASSRLKDKLNDAAGAGLRESSHSLQDRLFAKLLKQIVPPDEVGEDVANDPSDTASNKYLSSNRPHFSLPLMTNNFRRFNSRVGIVFVFQNHVIRLLTWNKAAHTLSFFAIYTFVCLNPYLLAILPFIGILFFVLVPAFLARHPPPPSPVIKAPAPQYSIAGPPLAPARTIKPATEISRAFFRNMRDLQNCLDDFSNIYDTILAYMTPPTNFSNEPLSSTVFLFLFVTATLLLLTSHLLPWRLIALLVGWSLLALGHPSVQLLVSQSFYKTHIRPAAMTTSSWLDTWMSKDIVMDAVREQHEVEIFEFQRRTDSGGSLLDDAGEWESWIFSSSPWEPKAPARVAGERLKGTRFFEDVRPPPGWEWEGKKWKLDLGSREWVEQRLIGGVEVEVEGERWVYDIEGEVNGKGESNWRKRGQWRRRRWVRMVRRSVLGGSAA